MFLSSIVVQSALVILTVCYILSLVQPGATTRKPTYNERKYSETSYHVDDEDGTNKKYTRRGKMMTHLPLCLH